MYAAEYYENALIMADATVLGFVDATHLNVDFDLLAGGTISGKATKQANGLPLEDVCVSVEDPDGYSWYSTTTAADGTYTLTGLNGTYKVFFRDCQNGTPVYLQAFYPGVGDEDSAQLVTVNAGENVPNINVALAKGGIIKGFVRDQDHHGVQSACVYAYRVLDSGDIDYQTSGYSDQDGAFEIGALPATNYKLEATWCGGGPSQINDLWFGDVTNSDDSNVVAIAAGQTLGGQNFNVMRFAEFGDGDCNGHANLADLLVILNDDAGLMPASDCLENADINCDGGSNIDDVNRYLAIYAGVDVPLISNCPALGPFPAS